MLKEQSAKEGNPFVSSTSGMWDNAKEFVGDMLGHETHYLKQSKREGNAPDQPILGQMKPIIMKTADAPQQVEVKPEQQQKTEIFNDLPF